MIKCQQQVLDSAANGTLLARNMHDQDLPQVMQIEQNAQQSPWARLSFEESLSRSQNSNAHACRVLCLENQVLAYHVVSAVLDELHILNVVTAPQLQGIGLGHRLMQDIIEIAQQHALDKLFLEVRASNIVAQSLYEKWGFKRIALRKQYYRSVKPGALKEDAFVYIKELTKGDY